ncbi:MAG: Ig-like domain-containing protein, partial [Pseudoflavonifractor sp.]
VEATVRLHLLTAQSSAPIAENLALSTYRNVAITGQFAATDLEGDLLTFQLVSKPARGAVTLLEDGSARFVYTPYENKTGKDTFTYVAVDAVGNTSAPATVKLAIEKANTKVTYADMDGVPAHRAAIRLAEEGVYVGACMGEQYFFQPEAPVTRSAFVAMAMNACNVEALEGVQHTGFADDLSIPTWAKPYLSSALKSGLVQGAQDACGQVIFNPAAPISRAEASVLLNRLLRVTDVSAPILYPDAASAPVWAYQSAVNLASCGVLVPDCTGALALDNTLTHADAAELLCAALDVLDSRDSGGWFKW